MTKANDGKSFVHWSVVQKLEG